MRRVWLPAINCPIRNLWSGHPVRSLPIEPFFSFTTVSYLLVHLRCVPFPQRWALWGSVLSLFCIGTVDACWTKPCLWSHLKIYFVCIHIVWGCFHIFKRICACFSTGWFGTCSDRVSLRESFIFPFASESTNKYLLNFIILLTFKFRLVSNYWLALKDGN